MKTIRSTTTIMLAGMLLVISCKKESTKTSLVPPTDPNECVQGQSANNGDIIPGQYIIAYNSNVVSRMAGEEGLVNAGADVLVAGNAVFRSGGDPKPVKCRCLAYQGRPPPRPRRRRASPCCL